MRNKAPVRIAYDRLVESRIRLAQQSDLTRLNRSKRWLGTTKVTDILASFNPGAENCNSLVMTKDSLAYGLRSQSARLVRGSSARICKQFSISRSTLWRILRGLTLTAKSCWTVLWRGSLVYSCGLVPQSYLRYDMRRQWRRERQQTVELNSFTMLDMEEVMYVTEGSLPPRWFNRMCDLGWSMDQINKWCQRRADEGMILLRWTGY